MKKLHPSRRQWLALLGSGILWPVPVPAAAEPAQRVRRVAALIFGGADNRGSQAQAAALREGLRDAGWVEGTNVRIDVRFESDPKHLAATAEQLARAAPDAIVANTNSAVKALQGATRTIPIVFAGVGDPVANGLVANLARPAGNTTGITNLFFSIGGKWLELLNEIKPGIANVAVMSNAQFSTREDWLAAIVAAAPNLGMTASKLSVGSIAEIERAFGTFGAQPNSALIVVPPGFIGADRDLIVRLAKEVRVPIMFPSRAYPAEGGLMSYGPDGAELFRQAGAYVDRILRGASPGDLPIQFPSKFELVINRVTAQAIGLEVPMTLLARADELIE
jgi:putative ABC transport system substrate-binding protein